jgi:hypothetical protein
MSGGRAEMQRAQQVAARQDWCLTMPHELALEGRKPSSADGILAPSKAYMAAVQPCNGPFLDSLPFHAGFPEAQP